VSARAVTLTALIRRFDADFAGTVVLHETTESTNDDAKLLAREGAPSGSVVIADSQTRGRGRGSNVWHSPPGANLYLSMLLRPTFDAAKAPAFALASGCVVAAAIERRLPPVAPRVRIKWPNDIFADGKKVAGILIEAQLRGDVLGSIVVGIGVNVATKVFTAELDQRATSLALLGVAGDALDRDALAAEIVVELTKAVSRYERGALESFAPELAARDALRGRRVRVLDVEGVADGIEADGRIALVLADGQRKLVASGHVDVL
jgi:BirA family transcriptional regulator, biotin operon repressor / biotin---[acetyl-CoA-carboxylase] ligase